MLGGLLAGRVTFPRDAALGTQGGSAYLAALSTVKLLHQGAAHRRPLMQLLSATVVIALDLAIVIGVVIGFTAALI